MYFHTGFFNYAEGIPQFCVLHYKKIYLFATVMAWECSFLVAEQEKYIRSPHVQKGIPFCKLHKSNLVLFL